MSTTVISPSEVRVGDRILVKIGASRRVGILVDQVARTPYLGGIPVAGQMLHFKRLTGEPTTRRTAEVLHARFTIERIES